MEAIGLLQGGNTVTAEDQLATHLREAINNQGPTQNWKPLMIGLLDYTVGMAGRLTKAEEELKRLKERVGRDLGNHTIPGSGGGGGGPSLG